MASKPGQARKKGAPKLSIIILNWNGKSLTREAIGSVLKSSFADFEIIVLDNGSTDGSHEFISRLYKSEPRVRPIHVEKNLGFTGGNNVGMRNAEGNLFLLLNNDTEIDSEMLGTLVKAIESDEKIGMVGPMIYFHSRPNIIWAAGGELKPYGTKMRGFNEPDAGKYNKPEDVDFLTGCALMVKRKVVEKIGPLDDVFFATGEDVDWCLSAKEAGYRAVFVPSAKMWHKVEGGQGRTISKSRRAALRRAERNMLILASKHKLLTPKFMFLDALHAAKLSFQLAISGDLAGTMGVIEGKCEFYTGSFRKEAQS